jgi:DNA-binding protein H-NS
MRCGYCEIGYMVCPSCEERDLVVDLSEQYCPSCGLSLLLDIGASESYGDTAETIEVLKKEVAQHRREARKREQEHQITILEIEALKKELSRHEQVAKKRERDLRQYKSDSRKRRKVKPCKERKRAPAPPVDTDAPVAPPIDVDVPPLGRRVKLFSGLDNKTGVYILHLVGTSLFKIGKSINVRNRVVSIQQVIPLPVRVVGLVECSRSTLHRTEQDLHKQFKANRYTGEWFELTMEQALEIGKQHQKER